MVFKDMKDYAPAQLGLIIIAFVGVVNKMPDDKGDKAGIAAVKDEIDGLVRYAKMEIHQRRTLIKAGRPDDEIADFDAKQIENANEILACIKRPKPVQSRPSVIVVQALQIQSFLEMLSPRFAVSHQSAPAKAAAGNKAKLTRRPQ